MQIPSRQSRRRRRNRRCDLPNCTPELCTTPLLASCRCPDCLWLYFCFLIGMLVQREADKPKDSGRATDLRRASGKERGKGDRVSRGASERLGERPHDRGRAGTPSHLPCPLNFFDLAGPCRLPRGLLQVLDQAVEQRSQRMARYLQSHQQTGIPKLCQRSTRLWQHRLPGATSPTELASPASMAQAT